jgi:hypothetical protein
LRDCIGADESAARAESCIRQLVESRNGEVDWVRFEPNGKRARVRFRWNTQDEKRAIIFDLQAEDVHDDDLLSADEMDALREHLR